MTRYARPHRLDDALALRAAGSVTVLAGATDIYPAKAARAGWGDFRHPDVLDIGAIDALRGISEEADHLRIGALVTWTEIKTANLPKAFAGLQAAAGDVGGIQIQNRGTLAGNLCTASPAGDGIPCLLALDASVELVSVTGRRRLKLAAFLTGYRATALRPDELVAAILVPKPAPGAVGGFRKLGARHSLVISIAMVSAVLDIDPDGRIARAAVAVGACGPVATRLGGLEKVLIGQRLADAVAQVSPEHLAALAPIDDIRASGAYRRAAALSLIRDLLLDLAETSARRAA